jgi:hypothetical protein
MGHVFAEIELSNPQNRYGKLRLLMDAVSRFPMWDH